MGKTHISVGHAGAPFRHGAGNKATNTNTSNTKTKRDATTADASCATGAFYTAPTLGATVDVSSPLTVSWNPALNCLQPAPTAVDILLYGPGDATPLMYTFSGVSYSAGTYNADVVPGWWNATAGSSKQLQVMIVSSGTKAYLSTLPAGPVFTADVPASIDSSSLSSSSSTSSGITYVSGGPVGAASSHSLSPGKKAAAVLLPLLFVILCGLAYLKVKRTKGKAARSAWSEKLDKRMSTISADWKSITPGGAKEAIRQSIAVRNSSFSIGQIQPGNVEGEPVVMGEKTRGGSIEISEKDLPRTTLGAGVGVGVGARRPRTHATPPERTSRAVSFADSVHPRPSIGSRPYSRGSRAFHTASYAADDEDVPAVPAVPALPSPSRAGAFGAIERLSNPTTATNTASVYGNSAAWSSGERVEGVDGGYGAQAVSPTGRVHTINYPSAMLNSSGDSFAYGTPSAADNSYFSPVTPTPTATAFSQVYEPSADSAYAPNTFGSFTPASSVSTPDLSGSTSPRQTAGPLTLTPEDIRRRMTMNHGTGQEAWRQSVDEVFGALSMMRTGSTSPADAAEDDGGDYLFAQPAETVFAYPGTPAPGSQFSSPASPYTTPAYAAASSSLPLAPATVPTLSAPPKVASSPFAMPMQPPTMSPDAMLRAYAAKSAKHVSGTPVRGATPISGLQDAGMRVLYKPDAAQDGVERAASPGLIRAGPGARMSAQR